MQQLLKFFSKYFYKESGEKVIILGTEYPEFRLFKLLKSKGNKVLFFISEDPWKYNIPIEDALCRYPDEVYSLCERYKIDCVYYCESSWLAKIPELPIACPLVHFKSIVND